MRGRLHLAALGLVAALAALPTPAAGSHGSSSIVLVNLQAGEGLGCGSGIIWSVDLQARVWHAGRVVAETAVSPGAWYETFEVAVGPLPATLEIEVRDEDFSFFGSSWRTCDAAPGEAERATITVGSSGVAFDSRGNDGASARVVGYAARATAPHPAEPTLALASRTTGSLTFTTDAWTGAQDVFVHQHARQTLPAGATSFTVEGLEENEAYPVRVVRASGPWRVGSPVQWFSTENAPNAPPAVGATPWYESANLTWQAVPKRDVAAVEVHLSRERGFAPSDATLVHRRAMEPIGIPSTSGAVHVEGLPPEPHYVRAVVEDTGGLRSVSDEVEVVPYASAPPGPPSDVSAAHTRHGARLSWTASPARDLAGYEVFFGERGGAPAMRATTQTALDLEGLSRGATYDVSVVAVGLGGLRSAPANVSFVAELPNAPPQVRAPPPETRGRLARLVPDATDPDGEPVRVRVEWGDGEASDAQGPVEHLYARPGSYVARVLASDPEGATASLEVPVLIANAAPTVVLVRPAEAGSRWDFSFDASASSDADGDALSFAWSWGDGTVGDDGPLAAHRYGGPGRYLVRVEARDAWGAVGVAEQEVVVAGGVNRPPVVALSVPASAWTDEPVVADARGSFDPDGQPVSLRVDWGDGSPPADPAAFHRYRSPGTYVVNLTVTDPPGLAASATAEIVVRTYQAAPTPDGQAASSPPTGAPSRTAAPSSVDARSEDLHRSSRGPEPPPAGEPRRESPGLSAAAAALAAALIARRRR